MGLFKDLVVEEKVLIAHILEKVDDTPELTVRFRLKSNAAWRDMTRRWSKRDSDEADLPKMAKIYADEVIAEDGKTDAGESILAVIGLTLDNLYRLMPGVRVPAEQIEQFRANGAVGLRLTKDDFKDLFLAAQNTFSVPLMNRIGAETRAYGDEQARAEAAARKNLSSGHDSPSD